MPRTAKLPATKRPAKAKQKTLVDISSPEWIARRNASLAKQDGPREMDFGDPTAPSGHEYGVRTSSRLIRQYRELHRKLAMDITPQPVIDVLVKAGVKKWVLVGLHGYVGYLPEPRATQDVDIMIAASERKRAVKAIQDAWPTLIVETYSEVVRFKDPNDPDLKGNPRPTIDIMLPWSEFQQTILNDFVVIEKKTKHRIPTLDAAIVSKFAAMVSVMRRYERKEQDAVDFRRMVRANFEFINRESLRHLAGQVWQEGADEIERFLDIAMSNKPFAL
ncbi:MAG: hypothetical protein NT013_14805 [Planctomycetia bacterium]|nr:hypothetical protein [Planctomycetia bacterium]